jgi:hypothetical protein
VQLSSLSLPERRAPHLEASREQALCLGLGIPLTAPHRRGVSNEHDARRFAASTASAGELRDDLGQAAEGVGADLDPAHAYGGEPPFGIGAPEGLAQAVEVGGVCPG